MGSEQLLAYSTISPCCTKISAGRSSWLCQGTMPPAEAQLAPLNVGGLLLQVDRAERSVGYANRLVINLFTSARFYLADRAFARDRRRCRRNRPGKREAEPERAWVCDLLEHVVSPLLVPCVHALAHMVRPAMRSASLDSLVEGNTG